MGKSTLACALAQEIGAEVIGADAFQIYSGLACLTAQPTPAQLAMVRHHMVGCIPVTQTFDVAEYHRLATHAIDEVRSRGLVPLVVGGTGLYVRALMGGLTETPPADIKLRERLGAMDLSTLIAHLGQLDPAAPAQVDLQNRRRVERAIEICETSGRPLADFRGRELPGAPGILLTRNRAVLHDRIAQNVEHMFASGVIAEVQKARDAGPTASKAIGFREIGELINGQISETTCREKITVATRQYARRQMTWFKNQTQFPAIDLTDHSDISEVIDALNRALTRPV